MKPQLESSSIPVESIGKGIAFGTDERTLYYDSALTSIVIGNQKIGFDPVTLTAIV